MTPDTKEPRLGPGFFVVNLFNNACLRRLASRSACGFLCDFAAFFEWCCQFGVFMSQVLLRVQPIWHPVNMAVKPPQKTAAQPGDNRLCNDLRHR